MNKQSIYNSFTDKLKNINSLKSILHFLSWDEQVNLPPKSITQRSNQSASLAAIIHKESTTPEFGRELEALEKELENLSPQEQVVIKETRKTYDRLTKIPEDFVALKTKAKSEAYAAWLYARKNNDFDHFAPFLQKQLDFSIQEAKFFPFDNPYDYWIDQHDPAMDSGKIDTIFSALKEELIPLVDQIIDAAAGAPDPSILKGFNVEKQKAFTQAIAKQLGFDFSSGRLDTSTHPFCGGNGQDTRITTRFFEDIPLDSLFSTIHEVGHALYEQGLPQDTFGTPLSEAIGMCVHESQSRLWENQIGRSRAFWTYWEPLYREYFKEELKNVSSEDFYRLINSVKRIPIRVDSDEVTYNLHIILRFELEKALFNQSLEVKDLPDRWNELSEAIIGLRPKNNTEGVLQDIHWTTGFGYFPSYCLGNVLAAQLWDKINQELPNLDQQFSSGNFAPVLNWLRFNIHQWGKQYDTIGLAYKVSGETLNPKHFINYLKERYVPLCCT